MEPGLELLVNNEMGGKVLFELHPETPIPIILDDGSPPSTCLSTHMFMDVVHVEYRHCRRLDSLPH